MLYVTTIVKQRAN